MKKLVSIILTCILILSLCITPVFAENTSKLASNLVEILDTMQDDEEIEVWVWNDGSAGSDYESNNRAILEKIGLTDENIIFLSVLTASFIVNVTKAQVYDIADCPEIVDIGFYNKKVKPDPEHLFEDRFIAQHGIVYEAYQYDEVAYHMDSNGEYEWALIYAVCNWPDPSEYYHIVGDRVWIGGGYTYDVCYCVYDVKADEFFDICRINTKQFDGLWEAIEEQKIGRPIGDVDEDGELTIIDATKIQRVLAQLENISQWELDYTADIDFDGECTITDVTGIQMKIAGIDFETKNEEWIFSDYGIGSNPQPMEDFPQESEEVNYTVSLNESSDKNPYYYYYSDMRTSIIKSEYQYSKSFSIENDVFDSDFFEASYLITVTTETDSDGGIQKIEDIRKLGDTLYIKTVPTEDSVAPANRFYYSYVSVDPEELEGIENIVWVK